MLFSMHPAQSLGRNIGYKNFIIEMVLRFCYSQNEKN